jgi:hypothetical protein
LSISLAFWGFFDNISLGRKIAKREVNEMKAIWSGVKRFAEWVAVEKHLLPIIFVWIVVAVVSERWFRLGWDYGNAQPFHPVPYHVARWALFGLVPLVYLLVVIDAWARKTTKGLEYIGSWLVMLLLPMFIYVDGRYIAGGVMQTWFIAFILLGMSCILIPRTKKSTQTISKGMIN